VKYFYEIRGIELGKSYQGLQAFARQVAT